MLVLTCPLTWMLESVEEIRVLHYILLLNLRLLNVKHTLHTADPNLPVLLDK